MIVVLSDFCAATLFLLQIATKKICMFEKLRQKWKVNVLQLVLILCTFAIGGSLTGYAAKKIMNILPIEADWLWAIIYILLVTIIWPAMVLIVSLPFGQFRFFYNYTLNWDRKWGWHKIRKTRSQNSRKSGSSRIAIIQYHLVLASSASAEIYPKLLH